MKFYKSIIMSFKSSEKLARLTIGILMQGSNIFSYYRLGFSFSLVFLFCSLYSHAQTFVPINVTGFNHDLIANGSGGANRAAATTTITFDGVNIGGDNVMYSKDFRGNNNPNMAPTYGLPIDRIITSVNLIGANYLLAHYDSTNALVLKNNGSAGTLKLETPGVFSKIAFLGSSADGASTFNVVLNFSDGTNTNAGFTVPDWYNGSGFAVKGIGRVSRTTIGSQLPDVFTGDTENPRLYDNQITLNPPFNTKILTSITFTKTSTGGSTAILAINGITAINAPAAPVATAATSVNFPSFTANWLASSGTTSYVLDVSTSPTFSTLLSNYNNRNVGNVLSLQITGLVASQTYYYRIRAVNAAGVSASSNTINVPFPECPPGDFEVTTQAQVDNFKVLYPNCKQISGTFNITNTGTSNDINNVDGFSNIEIVTGTFNITHNTILNNLNGLRNLKQVNGTIWISNNSALKKLNSFNSLKSVNGLVVLDHKELDEISSFDSIKTFMSLRIENNAKLTTVNISKSIAQFEGDVTIKNNAALVQLDAIGNVPKVIGTINIENNSLLANLNAFNTLTSTTNLYIKNNAALVNLDNFSNLNTFNGSLQIIGNIKLTSINGLRNIPASDIKGFGLFVQSNPLLAICDLPNLCAYLQGSGPRAISGNAVGCESEQTVKSACSPPAAPIAQPATNVVFPGFTANWQASAGATEYFMDVSTVSNFSSFISGFNNRSVGNVTSFAVNGLATNTTHYYRIRASKSAGLSPNSNVITVSFAQCPQGDVAVSTQAQVDNFKIMYPSCIQINGNLNITDNSNITNLNGFSNLENVTGQINIARNAALVNLDGLQNLKSVAGNFWIAENASLTKINVFNKLTSSGIMYLGDHKELTEISGYASMTALPPLHIVNNAKLTLINFTNSISQINGYVNVINNTQLQSINALGNVPRINGIITLENNPLLTNLNAFSQLTSANELIIKNNASLINLDQLIKVNNLNGSLQIIGNPKLNNISGLSNIPSANIAGSGLIIKDNPLLAICNLSNFCTYLQGSGTRIISGNATGCHSEQAVKDACSSASTPATPIALPATNILSSGFTANWQSAARAVSYSIDVSTSSTFSTLLSAYNNLSVGNNLNLNITGLLNNQTYYYRVRATNNAGTSPNSNVISVSLSGCYVNIPDAYFKKYLVDNLSINTNRNQEIECDEAAVYAGIIECQKLQISDMTGLEAFANITELNCSQNLIKKLDHLDQNLKLKVLHCEQNELIRLDISTNSELETLDCNNNPILSLDISNNKKLLIIKCYFAKLKSLNLANGINVDMEVIEAQDNPDLICIQVDDADYSIKNWKKNSFTFDSHHTFSNKCSSCNDPAIIFISNFLVTSFACTEDSIRLIEYGSFKDIVDNIQFNWNFGNGQNSTDRDPIVIYDKPGRYNIELNLKSKDCNANLSKEIEILGCIKQNNSPFKFASFYPNPSFGNVRLKVDLPFLSYLSFKLYDTNSRLVFNKYYYESKSFFDEFPSKLISGIYYAEIIHLAGIERHKIIIY